MEEATSAAAVPLHHGLPDEIAIWEILVCLPPKALVRCRAVCRAWRCATSTRDFLLSHHDRQPCTPLLYNYDGGSLDIKLFDHRTGLAAADQLQSVSRFGANIGSEASCDGLLVHSDRYTLFSVCNPATRQYAPLPQLNGFWILGMYLHSPTGEYRLLLGKSGFLTMLIYALMAPDGSQDVCYVFTLGSGQPPRRMRGPNADKLILNRFSVLFRGSLHWLLEQHESTHNMLAVFDTTAELFRQMRAPAISGRAGLFEMGEMLGMHSFNDAEKIVDIWVTQDYEGEVWALKYRVVLPVAELRVLLGELEEHLYAVITSSDSDLLVLLKFAEWLVQVDMDGKLVSSFHHRGLHASQHRLKHSLVQHDFFPTLEGYAVNGSPFI